MSDRLKKEKCEKNEKIDELERFKNLVVGRELQMVKLKERIKKKLRRSWKTYDNKGLVRK